MPRVSQGSIRKRVKSWVVVVDNGVGPNGKRRQYTQTVRTQREARKVLVELLDKRDRGIDLSAKVQPETVNEYLDRWLEHVRSKVKPETAQGYSNLLRLHIRPQLGSVRLAQLRPLMIQNCYQSIIATRSAKTALNTHVVFRAALEQAVKWELLDRNPTDPVDAPRAPQYLVNPPTPEEVERICEAADSTPYGPLIRLAAWTGLRQGEVLALRWDNVDLDACILRVRQSKTRAGRRVVALREADVAMLREHRRRQTEQRLAVGPAYGDPGLVFATAIGTQIDAGNLRRAWAGITARAGVKARFHDLRHAHATLLLTRNVHPKLVQERLGHARITVTLDTYSHVLPHAQAEVVAALEAGNHEKPAARS